MIHHRRTFEEERRVNELIRAWIECRGGEFCRARWRWRTTTVKGGASQKFNESNPATNVWLGVSLKPTDVWHWRVIEGKWCIVTSVYKSREIFEDAHKNSNRDRASFLFNGQADQSLDIGHHHNFERRFQDLVTDDYQQPPPVSDADDSYDLEDGPGIEGLMITGDPKAGRTLRGCGYAVRGTIECMFQWARHFEDGTLEYIVGATHPEYVVTTDDVDKVIALECVPVDNQGRQGKVVRAFANDQKKITHGLEDGPGIEGLMITGDPKAGRTLRGCGYAVRGTIECMFQWARHYEDGTLEYIEGATNPEYVVTADDVDKVIALECVPINNHGTQGGKVRVFANKQKKIPCDPEMQQEIDNYMLAGQKSFSASLLMGTSNEPITFYLGQYIYKILINSVDKLYTFDKYSSDLSIKIPRGLTTKIVLIRPRGSPLEFDFHDVR
ncbi:hypothetical protein E3N88_08377 [Mikania micrantha]|uniref:AIR9-like A9 domain-containing protein n=1 Tax=Mikania micrantha TaxID=192012 RepID=A0A5N6PHY9_9ASTR|nr:hypothetical protein E3N88_08377 [Mikania micrantha]